MRRRSLRARLEAMARVEDKASARIGSALARATRAAVKAARQLREDAPRGAGEGWVRAQPAFRAADVAHDQAHDEVAAVVAQGRDAGVTVGLSANDTIGDIAAEVRAALAIPDRVNLTLDRLREEQRVKVAELLVQAIDNRTPYPSTARQLREVAGLTVARAQLIARTEQYRAYREAGRLAWAYDDNIIGWRWVCRCDPTSCGACFAKHNTIYDLSVPMVTHPGCRCSSEPVTLRTRVRKTGRDYFEDLTPQQQGRVIGVAAADAYRDGLFDFDAVVTETRDGEWGGTIRTTPLRLLLPDPEVRARYLDQAYRR